MRVAGSIGFATSPVEGSFAPADGSWLLQPAPPEAPRPTDFVGGGNPFIIYLRIASSSDWMVVQRRHARALNRWLAIINALLVARLSGPPRFTTKHWVLRMEGDNPTAVWAQDWYTIPGFVPYPDGMPAAAARVDVVPRHEYYGLAA